VGVGQEGGVEDAGLTLEGYEQEVVVAFELVDELEEEGQVVVAPGEELAEKKVKATITGRRYLRMPT